MDEVIDLCSGSPPERKRNKRRRGDNEQPSNPTKRAPPEEVELSDGDDEPLALPSRRERRDRRRSRDESSRSTCESDEAMARRLQHEEHLQAAAAARAMPLDMFGPGGPGALPEPPAFLRGGRASWMPPPPPPFARFDRRDPDRHDRHDRAGSAAAAAAAAAAAHYPPHYPPAPPMPPHAAMAVGPWLFGGPAMPPGMGGGGGGPPGGYAAHAHDALAHAAAQAAVQNLMARRYGGMPPGMRGGGGPGQMAHLALLDRDFNEADYEMLLQLDEPDMHDPEKKRALKEQGKLLDALPSKRLSKGEASKGGEQTCAICLEQLRAGQTILTLRCKHDYQ